MHALNELLKVFTKDPDSDDDDDDDDESSMMSLTPGQLTDQSGQSREEV